MLQGGWQRRDCSGRLDPVPRLEPQGAQSFKAGLRARVGRLEREHGRGEALEGW